MTVNKAEGLTSAAGTECSTSTLLQRSWRDLSANHTRKPPVPLLLLTVLLLLLLLCSGGELRLSDLLGGLSAAGIKGVAGRGGGRKLLEKLDKRSAPVTAPLPRTVADRLERKAGYDDTKQEVTKWQPIVKVRQQQCI